MNCFTQDLHHFTFDLPFEALTHHIFDRKSSLTKIAMKKNIIIICSVIITFGLSSFGYLNWNNTPPELEEMTCQKTVELENELRDDFRNVTLSVLHNDRDVQDLGVSEMGQNEVLNTAQLNLLLSTTYSTNLLVTALYVRTNKSTGLAKDDSLVDYMTIIPEKEAVYKNGQSALIEYLKVNSKDQTRKIEEEKLQRAKIFFTITKKGTISNVKITGPSGYPSVDKELAKIISRMSKKWNPATNAKCEKVDQEFVFFFGKWGC
ncbi:MAG: hypothetical protein ACI837_003125 [Crocinitomicaceae bacterium]